MDTPLICGAVYTKDMRDVTYHALCVGTRIDKNGAVHGNLHVYGFAMERMTEGSEQMNEFTLISAPVFEKKRRRKAS